MNGLGVPEPEPFEATRAYVGSRRGRPLRGCLPPRRGLSQRTWGASAGEGGETLASRRSAAGWTRRRDARTRAAVRRRRRRRRVGSSSCREVVRAVSRARKRRRSAAALGSACVSGIGHVPADLDAAARRFEVAAERGVEEARLALAGGGGESRPDPRATPSRRLTTPRGRGSSPRRRRRRRAATARVTRPRPCPGETLDALVAARRGRETRGRWVDFERERGGVFVEGGAAGDPDGDRRGSGAVSRHPRRQRRKRSRRRKRRPSSRRGGQHCDDDRPRRRRRMQKKPRSESATIESAVAESAAATFDGVCEDGGACEHDRGRRSRGRRRKRRQSAEASWGEAQPRSAAPRRGRARAVVQESNGKPEIRRNSTRARRTRRGASQASSRLKHCYRNSFFS